MSWGRTAAAGVLAASAATASAAEPPSPTGRVEGGVSPKGAAARVVLVDRNVPQKPTAPEVVVREFAARVSADGSRYEADVPPGTYDLHVETKDGRKLEGADLRTGLEGDPDAKPLAEKDLAAIRARVAAMKTWADSREVLAVEGRGDRAKALVRLARTNPTSYDGEFGGRLAVFRWEVWSFRRRTGSWVRERECRVLRRFLVAAADAAKLRWEFRPDLGGVDVKAGAVVTRDVAVRNPAAAAEAVAPRDAE
jgi:hypothetical protein